METMEFNHLINQLENDEIQYNQLYGADIQASQYYSIQHYINHEHDNIDKEQTLKIGFFDIEVYNFNREYMDFKSADGIINAVTYYDTKTRTYYAFLLLIPKNLELVDRNNTRQYVDNYKNELIEHGYLKEDENIVLYIYVDDEIKLIQDYWKLVHDLDPCVLSGFNSDAFDLPYFYNRLMRLYEDEKRVAQTLSKFGILKTRKYQSGLVLHQIPELPICDIRRLYMPRSDGGLNYGKTLSSYSLDFISETELNLKKLAYKDTGMSLDQFYEVDPINFLKYNIMDVVLTVRLNEKLQHIELHNMLRRDMKTPFTSSLVGVSSLFSSMFNYELQKQDKKMRWGLLNETSNSIDEIEVENIEKPKESKMKWTVKKIDEQTYRKVISRFPGAYVKDTSGGLYTIKDGIIIDQDASLPPWEKVFIRRNNETHWGEIGDYEFMEGDETLTWNKNNETCWRQVKGKTVHNWNGRLLKITTETGKVVTVTDNHSIFGIKKGIKTTKINLLEAGELEVGDYVAGFKKFETDGKLKSKKPELLGFWLSDGWCTVSYNNYIAKQDKELLEIFDPYIENIRIKRKECLNYKEEWVGTVNKEISKELKPFTNSTNSKNFLQILNYDLKNRKAIWEGMMFSDGTIKGIGQHDVNTLTERLCKYRPNERDECFIVAHTIGWCPRNEINGIANVPIQNTKNQKYGPNLVCPEVFKTVYGACNLLSSKHNMSPQYRHHVDKLKNILPHVTKIYTETMGLEKIKKIEEINYVGKVYDLSVEETERFFAGTGIGVHNTALYPSVMQQYNISFDTYYGRVIDPVCYKFMTYLDNILGKNNPIDTRVKNDIFSEIKKYADRISPQNKNDYKQYCYFMFMYLLNKVNNTKMTLKDILKPKSTDDMLLLKMYLLPLLDLFVEIKKPAEYHTFAYEHIVNLKDHEGGIYIIQNENEPYINVMNMPGKGFYDYLVKNELSFSLSGALFYKKSYKTGILNQFLVDRLKMRKYYKNKRDECSVGTDDYKFYDRTQLATKINVNSSYGLTGLSSFQFSNKQLAASTTLGGRLALKTAQYFGEIYLNKISKEVNQE